MTAALGLEPARSVDPAGYAMSGRAPKLAIRPANRDELCEALRAAALERLAVVPWGGGVSLSREIAPDRFDAAIDLRALDAIIEYEPDDLTLTAECGATIESLRDRLAAHAQELPLEAAEAWGATLGGVLAANASGARRLALGAPRDRILGARFALGEGLIARSGGKVVKNVAGYGMHRLLCGSRGALGVIVEASLKLAPAPESRVAMIWGADASTIADAAKWRAFPRMEPAALTVVGRAAAALNPVLASDDAFTVIVGFEGSAAHVEHQCETARSAFGAARVKVSDDSAVRLWQQLADLEELQGARLTFTTPANTPAALAPLLASRDLERAVFHAACGRLHVFPAASAAQSVATSCAAHGFALIDARGAGAVTPSIPPQDAVGGMRASLRAALDPGRAFALGDRWRNA
jgi:glycolate oxidase FAD binding subunit